MEPNKTKPGEKDTLLIIEDEPSMRQALVDKFILEGFEVIVASNGLEGLSRAKTDHPDLIILDIIMPVMDGLTMLQKLRRDGGEYGKKVPVILLTNLNPDREGINRAIVDSEPAYYLVKTNWTIGSLVSKVKERLARVESNTTYNI